jgi:hypothetical protein
MNKNKVSLFLDSGAHSLFNKSFAGVSGKKGVHSRMTADYSYAESPEFKKYLDDYIKFVHDNKEYLNVYVNLDVIFNPEATWKVQQYMESQGLSPMPVFHYKEDFKWLKHYIDNYEYIGIGGLGQDITREKFIKWADQVFSIICDTPDRLPKVKTHGFALTSLKLMLRYPWYSVDSTSWVLTSRFGSVYVPKIVKGGKCIYDENNWKICVSGRSPTTTEMGQKHIDTFYSIDRKVILQYFKDKGYSLGKSRFFKRPEGYELREDEAWLSRPYIEYEEDSDGKPKKGKRGRKIVKQKHPGEVEKIIERGLCNDYKLRDEMNIIYFLDFEKSVPEWPWPFKSEGLKGFGL